MKMASTTSWPQGAAATASSVPPVVAKAVNRDCLAKAVALVVPLTGMVVYLWAVPRFLAGGPFRPYDRSRIGMRSFVIAPEANPQPLPTYAMTDGSLSPVRVAISAISSAARATGDSTWPALSPCACGSDSKRSR